MHKDVPNRKARAKSQAVLEAVGLGDSIDHYPRNFSGGQKQQGASARAFVGNPKLVLADKPIATLDSKSGHDII
jgi:putative ABC transport system ATP-binding protein